MIEIDISRKIKRYKGMEELSLKANFVSGAIMQISGPSGSGKTTLLRIIAGLVKPERGLILADGTTWLDTEKNINLPTQLRKVGFVFQDYALFPNMTVQQHLNYGTKDADFVERLLALGRMESFRNQKSLHLSGGQQQRLSILRALSTNPRLMLMDEPFSALDRKLKAELIPELKAFFTEMKTTCLIVSHHPLELEGIASQVLEL